MPTAIKTTQSNRVIDCTKCKAPHFTYQLTCKRCGSYLHKADVVAPESSHHLAVAGGILAVSTAILTVCALVHAF